MNSPLRTILFSNQISRGRIGLNVSRIVHCWQLKHEKGLLTELKCADRCLFLVEDYTSKTIHRAETLPGVRVSLAAVSGTSSLPL